MVNIPERSTKDSRRWTFGEILFTGAFFAVGLSSSYSLWRALPDLWWGHAIGASVTLLMINLFVVFVVIEHHERTALFVRRVSPDRFTEIRGAARATPFWFWVVISVLEGLMFATCHLAWSVSNSWLFRSLILLPAAFTVGMYVQVIIRLAQMNTEIYVRQEHVARLRQIAEDVPTQGNIQDEALQRTDEHEVELKEAKFRLEKLEREVGEFVTVLRHPTVQKAMQRVRKPTETSNGGRPRAVEWEEVEFFIKTYYNMQNTFPTIKKIAQQLNTRTGNIEQRFRDQGLTYTEYQRKHVAQ